jgi:pimeloyl-ACP methyl ester carboxylesterase
LADSPIALAAWMIDHDVASYAHIVKLFVDGEPYGDLTARRHPRQHHSLLGDEHRRVQRSALCGIRGAFFNDYDISNPAAVSVFPEEVYQAPRSWTERSYHKLIHFNEVPKGGHFAAWEQPKIFSEELRAGFRSLRTQQADKAV